MRTGHSASPSHLAHDLTGSGALVVAIHGITENRSFWNDVPLSEHHRVLQIDLPGHGESPRTGPFDPDTAADTIHSLVERVGDGKRPILLGHSFGAVIATIYASRYLTRGVINVDQTLNIAPLPPAVADTIQGGDIDGFVRPMFNALYGDLDPTIARTIDQQRTVDREVLAGNWQPLLTLNEDQLQDWLRRSTALPASLPYLSLHGFDPGEEYRYWLSRWIPNVVSEVAGTRTHYPHLADPVTFAARVHRFTTEARER